MPEQSLLTPTERIELLEKAVSHLIADVNRLKLNPTITIGQSKEHNAFFYCNCTRSTFHNQNGNLVCDVCNKQLKTS